MNFPCPHCGAVYTMDQVSPGDVFTCGECQETVTAPSPATPRPPVKGKAPARTAPGKSSAARVVSNQPQARGGARKSNAIVPVIAAVVVALGVGGYFAFGGKADKPSNNSGTPTSGAPGAPSGPAAPERAKAVIDALVAGHPLDSATGSYAASQALSAKAAEMKSAGTDRPVSDLVQAEAKKLRDQVLVLDPNFQALRDERGEVRYADTLVEFLDAAWLLETDRIEAKRAHDKITKAGAKSGGWVPKDQLAPVEELLAKLVPKRDARNSLESTPFFKLARDLEADVKADLEQRFAGVAAGQYRGVIVSVEKPYVFFIQADPSWDPVQIAKSKSRDLKALEDIILQEYGEALDLKPIEEPVPVLFFRNYDMYKKYAGLPDDTTTLAHFEPMTGRLAVHDNCDVPTIMHEGTHQLMWAWTERKTKDGTIMMARSYWFQEGIAEWYGGATRIPKSTGGFDYEIGRLHAGRMSNIRSLQTSGGREKLFKLKELLTRTYGHRPKLEKDGRTGALYGQAWFFIFFMNHFNVDAEGYVDPEKPGQYQAKWREYVKAELQGRTGIKTFRDVMGMTDEDIEKLEVEFWRYFDYVQRKISNFQVKDKQLIRWDKWRNKRGEANGDKADDLLPPLDPTNIPKAVPDRDDK